MIPQEVREAFMLALRRNGVTDSDVLAAMESVPRHLFVQGRFSDRAYEDRPLPIDCGQTISQPSVVGLMTEALDVGPRHKVLEIGAGSGYQAAILSRLARRVYTIERHPALRRSASAVFDQLRIPNITAVTGDGSLGMPEQAPFDRIMLTAAAEDPPAPLLAQLAVNGIMVLPVGQTDAVQKLIRIVKSEHGLDYMELEDVRFVPLLSGVAGSSRE